MKVARLEIRVVDLSVSGNNSMLRKSALVENWGILFNCGVTNTNANTSNGNGMAMTNALSLIV